MNLASRGGGSSSFILRRIGRHNLTGMKPKFERIEWEQKTQVRAHALLHYAIPHPRPERRYKAFDVPSYSGKMTDHAARRIRKTIDLFFQISPKKLIFNEVSRRFQYFQINFVTLTISCKRLIGSKEGYEKLLAPFLRKLRTHAKIAYVWKGELQKRGQPHWHITTNSFLHMTWVRNVWNSLQEKAGYLDEYYQEHQHYNAPSTEVKSVRNLKRVDLYLAKYLSKGDASGKWEGKIWGSSDNLRTGSQFSFSTNFEDDETVINMVNKGKAVLKRFDSFSITECEDPKLLLTKVRKAELEKYLNDLK